MKQKQLFQGLFMILAILLIGAMALFPQTGVQAAPYLAPTPIANSAPDGSSSYLNVTFQEATAITADTNTAGKQLPGYEQLAISYTIDQGTVNTTTLTLQYSNDNTNWFDGAAIVSNNAADATGGVYLPLGWRYTRVKQDVTNTNTITITLLAVAK